MNPKGVILGVIPDFSGVFFSIRKTPPISPERYLLEITDLNQSYPTK